MKPHLAELRTRLAISVAAMMVMFMVAFIFHNPILTWVTQPLNNALTQVRTIVEKRDDGTWKVHHPDANSTMTPTISASTPALPAQASTLHDRLHEAAKLLSDRHADQTDMELSRLLEQASESAAQMAKSSRTLLAKMQKDQNDTSQAAKASNSFWGSITTHQVGGAFFVALKVSFFAGLIFALPIILWQLWLFIAPGLYDNEKKMVLPFVVGGSVMFATGVLFAYYVVTPFGFKFLITFGSFLYTPLINIEDYVGFFTKILLGFGIAFELPVVAYFLGLIGLITDRTLIYFFRYAIVMIFILAALLTPPDVLTQVLMAAPLIILYGASIVILKFVNPEKPDQEETAAQTAPASKTDTQKSIHEKDEPFENGSKSDDEDFDFEDDDFDDLEDPK
jgi:sec-independent protein translocase protein TatC